MIVQLILVYGGGLLLLIALAAIAGRLGYAFPTAAPIVSMLFLCFALYMWYLIFSDKGDGPGHAFGVLIVGLGSLFPITIGLALAVGAMLAILAPNRSLQETDRPRAAGR